MNCTKTITITGYSVRFVDLREPKPRTIREEIYQLDKDALAALGLLGLNPADFIEERYKHSGYHVLSAERISARRIVSVDLSKLWEQSAPATATGEEDAASCHQLTNSPA